MPETASHLTDDRGVNEMENDEGDEPAPGLTLPCDPAETDDIPHLPTYEEAVSLGGIDIPLDRPPRYSDLFSSDTSETPDPEEVNGQTGEDDAASRRRRYISLVAMLVVLSIVVCAIAAVTVSITFAVIWKK